MSFPSPTFHLKPSSKLLSQPSEVHTSFKSFHQRELLLPFPSSPRLLHPSYLEMRTSSQKSPLTEPSLQIHFPNKAKLNKFGSTIPSPRNSRGLQTKLQGAQAIFLPSAPHPQRKFLCILTSFPATPEGNLNNDIKNNGIEESTDFIKQILLAIVKHLPFHLLNLAWTFSITRSKRHRTYESLQLACPSR